MYPMTFKEDIIKNDEKAIFTLRSLYQKYGYRQYKMSKFEEYDLYARNKDFLVSDSVITFTEPGGRLMALKPDVTLSIIKNSQDGVLNKVYYNENVYRAPKGSRVFKEIMQTGLECIGDIDTYNICEVVMLSCESLNAIDKDFVLDISHMGLISAVIEAITDDTRIKKEIVNLLGEKNLPAIKALCFEQGIDFGILETLSSVYGKGDYVLGRLKQENLPQECQKHIEVLDALNTYLKECGFEDKVNFDFSIVCDMKYYSAVVFKGYINGIAESVLTGGQYGKLLMRMGKKADAIGFAVYLDMLERLNTQKKKYDVDTVVLYDDDADSVALAKNIKLLTDIGTSVLAVRQIPDIKYKQLLKFNGKGVEILENND